MWLHYLKLKSISITWKLVKPFLIDTIRLNGILIRWNKAKWNKFIRKVRFGVNIFPTLNKSSGPLLPAVHPSGNSFRSTGFLTQVHRHALNPLFYRDLIFFLPYIYIRNANIEGFHDTLIGMCDFWLGVFVEGTYFNGIGFRPVPL